MYEWCGRWGLSINNGKCGTMKIDNQAYTEEESTIGVNKIKRVKEYGYLGSKIHRELKVEPVMNKRVRDGALVCSVVGS